MGRCPAEAAHVEHVWAMDDVIVGHPVDRLSMPPVVLGPDAHLRSGTIIYDGSTIGSRLETGHAVVIREQNELGDDVSVWTNSVIDCGCVIGDRVKIHTGCYIAQFSTIEADAFLAPGVVFANDGYPSTPGSSARIRGPHVEAGAQIGVNATLVPGVRIGAGAIVGAGAVVIRDVAPGTVVSGNPARPHGAVTDWDPVSREHS